MNLDVKHIFTLTVNVMPSVGIVQIIVRMDEQAKIGNKNVRPVKGIVLYCTVPGSTRNMVGLDRTSLLEIKALILLL